MSTALQTKIADLDPCSSLLQLLDELTFAVRRDRPYRYELRLWERLSLFFFEHPPKTITSKYCVFPLLTTRINKLGDPVLTSFLDALAKHHNLGFEAYESCTTLTFLKALGREMNSN